MEKRWLYALFIAVILLNSVWIITYNKDATVSTLASLARVALTILGNDLTIQIVSPENATYNYSIGENLIIDLNVSSWNFQADTWWYNLYDLRHDTSINNSAIFTPNTTINAVRWSNRIEVYANDSSQDIGNTNVTFFVFVPNSAPLIEYLNTTLFVCENSYISYIFNATDADEDSLSSDISPKNPFYVFSLSSFNLTKKRFELISGTITKSNAGGVNAGYKVYEETIYITDNYNSTCCTDSNKTNITVIEINNAPSISAIGVQTIYSQGENSSFYKQVQVTDTEDGNQDSGTLKFNISFSGTALFNISSNGIMNFTINSSLNRTGVYNMSVCVGDTGIDNPHPEIVSVCNQTEENRTSCENFSLTITEENRQPTITSYLPLNLSFNASSTTNLQFNITKYDPDGTIPDTYWYASETFVERDSGSLSDKFEYTFGCDVEGNYTIKAVITDGLLNDSLQWNVSVLYENCTITEEPGGGGGGGIGCSPKWVCGDWGVCQDAEKALRAGILTGESYRIIKNNCSALNFDTKVCGAQLRNCFDVGYCNKTIKNPGEMQSCFYTKKPTCSDGIKNCHDEACELLIDCGGPCEDCPTCSDEIKNQNEIDADCGGPCPSCTRELLTKNVVLNKILRFVSELPLIGSLIKKSYLAFAFVIVLFFLVILVVIEAIRLFRIAKRVKKYKNENFK